MHPTLTTAAEFRKALESRLQILSLQTGESIRRLRRIVAFDRLLARICTEEPPSFLLKGGYGMELRIAQARATKDIDLTCLKRSHNTSDPMTELISQELQELARIDLNDNFIFQIGQPQSDIENAPYGGSRHKVLTIINNSPFAEFKLDVGADFLIGETEKIIGKNWLEFCGIAAPTIPMISVEQQFAEKLHTYTLPREQINTRTKDLIDLILLLEFKNRAPEAFHRSLTRVFKARNTHTLPESLPEPPASWQKPFAEMAAECGISQNMEEGFSKVAGLYSELNSQFGHKPGQN